MLRKQEIRSEFVTLAVAAFLCAVYNKKFWTTFFGVTGGWSMDRLPLHICSFLIIVTLFNAALTLARLHPFTRHNKANL